MTQEQINRQIVELDNELIQALIKGFQESIINEDEKALGNIKGYVQGTKLLATWPLAADPKNQPLSFDPKFWTLFMAMIELSLITMLPLQDSLRALRLEVSPDYKVVPTPETVQWFENMVENLSKPQKQEQKEESLAEPTAA